MTLLALVLAIGLVVDDAIVVVENIHRHIEQGMRPFDAALLGAREILYPIIAMTITLAAVYAPIAFVSGLTGVSVPRVRADARRRGDRVGRHRRDAVADDVLEAAQGGKRAREGRLAHAQSRPAVRGAEAALSAAPRPHPELSTGDAAGAGRRDRGDRTHVYDDAAGARAGGGPGHPVHAGEDAAIRQSRLSRGSDGPAQQACSAPCRRRTTSSPSTAWATCIRALPASC